MTVKGMRIYICNAFSLSMLDREQQGGTPSGYVPRASDARGATARIPRPVSDPAALLAEFAKAGAEIVSAVGHLGTAAVLGAALGRGLDLNRVTLRLGPQDRALIGQYVGPRLPEGATVLPDGATIEWWIV